MVWHSGKGSVIAVARCLDRCGVARQCPVSMREEPLVLVEYFSHVISECAGGRLRRPAACKPACSSTEPASQSVSTRFSAPLSISPTSAQCEHQDAGPGYDGSDGRLRFRGRSTDPPRAHRRLTAFPKRPADIRHAGSDDRRMIVQILQFHCRAMSTCFAGNWTPGVERLPSPRQSFFVLPGSGCSWPSAWGRELPLA